MAKRFWINNAGTGFDEDMRQICFGAAEEDERQLLLGSGLRVRPYKLNDRWIRFHKKDRRKVVAFFGQHDIQVNEEMDEMTVAEYRERVGTAILDQLASASGGAGKGRLRAMLGATDFVTLIASVTSREVPPCSHGVGFRFKGCKDWNGVEIFLDEGRDQYLLRFYRMRLEATKGTGLTLGPWIDDIYASELAINFQERTGLDTHL